MLDLKAFIKELALIGILATFGFGWAFGTLFMFFHFGFIAGGFFGASASVLLRVWGNSESANVLTFIAQYIRYGIWPEAVIEPRAPARGF